MYISHVLKQSQLYFRWFLLKDSHEVYYFKKFAVGIVNKETFNDEIQYNNDNTLFFYSTFHVCSFQCTLQYTCNYIKYNNFIKAYMPTVQIKEEHSSFWEKIIIILMQVFLFLYKFVCSIE